MATDNKFQSEFDRLCHSRQRYLSIYSTCIRRGDWGYFIYIFFFIQTVDKLACLGETGAIFYFIFSFKLWINLYA